MMLPGRTLLLLLCSISTCLPDVDQGDIVILEHKNFDHIPKSLKTTVTFLSLSWNSISGVGLNDLKEYRQLKTFKLSHNHLHSSKDLIGLMVVSSLLHLDVSHNYLKAFDFQDLRGNLQLLKLKLSHNQKLQLAKHVKPLLKLEKLSLADCGLGDDIPWEIFEGFPALTHLDLQRNSISSYPQRVFDYFRNLKYLDLSYNNIITLDFNDFYWNLELRTLRFCHNKNLTIVQDFGRLSKLEEIYLQNCSLGENIPWEIFEALPSLVIFNLTLNNISNIPRKVFDNFRQKSVEVLLDKHVPIKEIQNLPSSAADENKNDLDESRIRGGLNQKPNVRNLSTSITYSVSILVVISVLAMILESMI